MWLLSIFGVKANRGPKGGLGFLRFLGSLYKSWRLVRVGAKVVADKVKEIVCVGVWVVDFGLLDIYCKSWSWVYVGVKRSYG